ncbi:hypothetical protein [Chelativorans sp. YIM 93263]|uniref:hypothetical protein n=1 Tax=Chelativorans sp. YIM 93263 TaxID=2906648 RepID=UPI002379F9F9|nr:hypothetical protein [Chelativorans sp. YIM 93263]
MKSSIIMLCTLLSVSYSSAESRNPVDVLNSTPVTVLDFAKHEIAKEINKSAEWMYRRNGNEDKDVKFDTDIYHVKRTNRLLIVISAIDLQSPYWSPLDFCKEIFQIIRLTRDDIINGGQSDIMRRFFGFYNYPASDVGELADYIDLEFAGLANGIWHVCKGPLQGEGYTVETRNAE